ncbi:hypothetical protein L3X38_017152 [Prunus dulcis]|uniref:Uncharacterized protein n=1 Tax=Prunus dulcis TaxID=3755 RepID=A0AAD4Z9S6_PRUDU|nr:hypothetical protein L3X38_017152 [Prunus dulcis]
MCLLLRLLYTLPVALERPPRPLYWLPPLLATLVWTLPLSTTMYISPLGQPSDTLSALEEHRALPPKMSGLSTMITPSSALLTRPRMVLAIHGAPGATPPASDWL